MPLSERARQEILAAKAAYPQERTAILPALRAAQRDQGHLGQEQVYEIAELMELDPNAVQMLVTFYDMLYREPKGRYVLGVCKNISCYLRGADQIIDHVCRKLGIGLDETTPDGVFTVRPFECLASCGSAPVILVNNEEYREWLTIEQVDRLLEELRSRPAEAAREHGVPWPVYQAEGAGHA
ncbi:MAG TPA: NADH-quinone oxidoreductase subunit NuoE [Chloroflexota bacterium]|nr:NADH-quinone oxidoreductase subunit NuoE [Chloroflexota bacterium]